MNLQLEQLTVARNICLSLKGYFEADEDLKARKKQNSQKMSIVTVPISQNILQGEIDIMKNITLRADGRYMGRKQINGQIVTVYARNASECATRLKRAIKEALRNPKSHLQVVRLAGKLVYDLQGPIRKTKKRTTN